jgi:hypothetical protein
MAPVKQKTRLKRMQCSQAAGKRWTVEPGRSRAKRKTTRETVTATVRAEKAQLARAGPLAVRRVHGVRASNLGLELEGGRRACLAQLSIDDYVPAYLACQRHIYNEATRHWDVRPSRRMVVWRAPESQQDDPLGRVLFAHEFVAHCRAETADEEDPRPLAPTFTCYKCKWADSSWAEALKGCCAECAKPLESAMLAQAEYNDFGHEFREKQGDPALEVPVDISGALALWMSRVGNEADGPEYWRVPELREADDLPTCMWCGQDQFTRSRGCVECEALHAWARRELWDDVRAMLLRWRNGAKLIPGSLQLLAHFSNGASM